MLHIECERVCVCVVYTLPLFAIAIVIVTVAVCSLTHTICTAIDTESSIVMGSVERLHSLDFLCACERLRVLHA